MMVKHSLLYIVGVGHLYFHTKQLYAYIRCVPPDSNRMSFQRVSSKKYPQFFKRWLMHVTGSGCSVLENRPVDWSPMQSGEKDVLK